MINHLNQIAKKLSEQKKILLEDPYLYNDIDQSLEFPLPYSKSHSIGEVKLIFLGQDPTVRNINSRKLIKTILNLDKENSLRSYLKMICDQLGIDLDKEVYATNLYKCFFNFPPADDEKILSRQFRFWMDFLISELKPFQNPIIITLGEPLLRQLLHNDHREVKYYWNYIGNTKTGKNFKYVEPTDNYLQKRIYPLPHQPTWGQNKFYKIYLEEYLNFIFNENVGEFINLDEGNIYKVYIFIYL
jgi:hypothetical protein